jgi:hypothetical protein
MRVRPAHQASPACPLEERKRDLMLEIMPESQANILGVKATGKLTSREFQEVLVPHLKAVIKEHGRVRLLFCLDEDVQGWDLAALEHDGFGRNDLQSFQKVAVVGASWQINLQMKMLALLLSGEVRNFSRDELYEAWTWIKG